MVECTVQVEAEGKITTTDVIIIAKCQVVGNWKKGRKGEGEMISVEA
jgi:hypothetical protein